MSTASSTTVNRRIVLARRPQGEPTADDFRIEEVAAAVPSAQELGLETVYLSLDPYMRGRLSDAPSYDPPVAIGDVIVGATVSRVTHPATGSDLTVGDLVVARTGWQTHAVARPGDVRRVPPSSDLPASTALGVLGMPGFTAYSGLLNIGQPQPGETVVVAAATGPVGSAVGQIARLHGARAVAVAGGSYKQRYATTRFGFDAAVDHRSPTFPADLAAACPDGIDVYFENVGGPVADAVLPLLNQHARIPLCGLVSQYNSDEIARPGPDRLPFFMSQLLAKSITVQGFLQRQYFAEQFDTFTEQMAGWIKTGEVAFAEAVTDGLDNAPEAFTRMLVGDNLGKTVIRVRHPDTGELL